MAENSTVDAVIFDGGYGVDYVEFAADIFAQTHEGSTVEVSPSTLIATELQPRFVGGNPPDLVDNSGAQAIGLTTILDQLEDLTDVIDAPNLEGTTIRDTLYGGVLAPGTFEGKLAAINYAFTVYGVWYSEACSRRTGGPRRRPGPRRSSSARGGGAGQVPVLLGQGGGDLLPDDVHRLGDQRGRRRGPPGTGEPGGGLLVAPAVQAVFTGLKAVIDAGYMQPGGGGTQFTQAQAQWSSPRTRSCTRRARGSRTR